MYMHTSVQVFYVLFVIYIYCIYIYIHILHVCVPVVLSCHLSGRPLRPFLWCRAVVCHPDVVAEERRVQLVPGDFPPEPLTEAGPLGRAMQLTYVCLFLPTSLHPPLHCCMTLCNSTSHLHFPLLLRLTCCFYFILLLLLLPLACFHLNSSWFSTPSVGYSYHIYCTGLWAVKLHASLHRLCGCFSFSKLNFISLCHHAAPFSNSSFPCRTVLMLLVTPGLLLLWQIKISVAEKAERMNQRLAS